MKDKEDNFKEQFKQALTSTTKVISDDYKIDPKRLSQDNDPKKTSFFDVSNLSNNKDFVRLRAEADSLALKKKFSNNKIFKQNLPDNSSCRTLYDTAEKIRYEILGSKMLKGIKKNIAENYSNKMDYTNKNDFQNK